MTVKLAYMDAVDFQHELGAVPEITLYSSLDKVLEGATCAEECGVVSVTVSLYKQEREGKFSAGFTAAEIEGKSPRYTEYLRGNIRHWRARAERLQKQAQDLLRLADATEQELEKP